MKLINLGCGKNKIPNCTNIDMEASVEPDIVCDFRREPLPFEDETVDKVYFLHVIEHIEEKYHPTILTEIRRVLKNDGELILAYPEFSKCALNYINNHRGDKEFWKATIYGRQTYPSDFHVSLMDSLLFAEKLKMLGLGIKVAMAEPVPNEHNTVLKCVKIPVMETYEDILREVVYG